MCRRLEDLARAGYLQRSPEVISVAAQIGMGAGNKALRGFDRQGRFNLREGHDLERLLWPETGGGGSTGPLQNFVIEGRHPAAVHRI